MNFMHFHMSQRKLFSNLKAKKKLKENSREINGGDLTIWRKKSGRLSMLSPVISDIYTHYF